MRWHISDRADIRALPLADAHYSRQKPGTPQFVPPGSCLVLLTAGATALWTTSWPKAEFTKHAWAGAWVNSLFRNERRDLHISSELIREAVAATRFYYGLPPPRRHGVVREGRRGEAQARPGPVLPPGGIRAPAMSALRRVRGGCPVRGLHRRSGAHQERAAGLADATRCDAGARACGGHTG